MLMRVKWRGKPVWIVRRTPEALAALKDVEGSLRDPGSQEGSSLPMRVTRIAPLICEVLVRVGLCTHLGCSPTMVIASEPHSLGDDWKGGFFCHGSKFDFAGNVYKSVPAPTNMEVPPHRFVGDTGLVIGEDEGTA